MEPGSFLVTGGAGFIGSHLCERLLQGGSEVYCLDNLSTGKESNLNTIIDHPDFHLVVADVCDTFDYPVQCVIHLASPASPVKYMEKPVETLRANSEGTLRCLELARKNGALMIMGSTSEVYGNPEVSPQPESYFGNVNPVGIRSCYDEGKRFAEALCMSCHRSWGVGVVVLRIFNTYGARMRSDDGRVVPNFISQALAGRDLTVYGSGEQTRSFCYVGDMVRGMVGVVGVREAIGRVINLGNPNEVTILELANIIRDKCGSSSSISFKPLPPDDPEVRCPDTSLVHRLLGWEPEVSLDEGLDATIAWFREAY